MNTIEAVYIVCPRVLEMARRLEYAVLQIQSGQTRRDVIRMIVEKYRCSRMTAWRVVDMANDIAGKA